MVSQGNVIALFVSGIGCFAIPIIAFIIVRKKSKNVTGALFAGIISFTVMQVVIRIPIMQYVLPNMPWYIKMANSQVLLYALFLGFTAGLFETVGRYFTLKWFIRDKTSYYAGLSHGIGHGGIEAILLVGLNTVIYAVYAVMINNGTYAQMVDASAIGANGELVRTQMEALAQVLVNGTAGTTLLGLLERFLTLFIHIGLSLLVAEGIVKGKGLLYSLYALLFHALVDTTAVLMVAAAWNVYLIEGVIAIYAAVAIVYIFTSKKRFAAIDKVYPVEKEEKILESDY